MFVLILFAHVGAMGSGNSNSLAVAEFSSKEKCFDAGSLATKMPDSTTKVIKFICVPK